MISLPSAAVPSVVGVLVIAMTYSQPDGSEVKRSTICGEQKQEIKYGSKKGQNAKKLKKNIGGKTEQKRI